MERSTLASVYRYVLKSKAADMTSTNGTSVEYTEGVSDVERQPD
jgi:hypothetical protein